MKPGSSLIPIYISNTQNLQLLKSSKNHPTVVITSAGWFFDFENLCFQVFKTYEIKELIFSIF
jgi:hypothetical protein